MLSGFVIDDVNIDVNRFVKKENRNAYFAVMNDMMPFQSYRCIKLSIVHDFGESIIGDITPHDNVNNETKHKLESAAIEKLSKLLPNLSKGDEIRQLFDVILILNIHMKKI
jgi:5'-deoxynucleotidase YfbR-like HD superfamily hydrolase